MAAQVECVSADVANLALTRRDGTPVVMVQLYNTGRIVVSAELQDVAEDLHSVAAGTSADVMIEVVGSRVAVQVNGETILDAAVRIRSIAGVSFASVGGEARLDNLQVHRLMPM